VRDVADRLVRVASARTLRRDPPGDRVVERQPPRLAEVLGLPEEAVRPETERRRVVAEIAELIRRAGIAELPLA
jgi:hypothetical protein